MSGGDPWWVHGDYAETCHGAPKDEDMTELYKGFLIEPNDYGLDRNGDTWMWSPEEADGTPYQFEASRQACREAIDDLLAEQEHVIDQANFQRKLEPPL